MALKTRKPTGRVPWPLILVEGGEKAGKSWAAAVLTGSERVGRCRWLDLGEGAGDEYGAIPGANYEMCEHDGTWQSIIGAVEDARDEARTDAEAGQPPYVLIIDSMTLIWDMLKDWASNRARKTDSNKKKLREDPNAEIVVAPNFWNDANARHRRLMTMLMTFPGVVICTARGKEVAELDSKGTPITGRKGYRVEGHKDLAFDATVWLRLARDDEPLIVGCRSVHAGIQPGADKARRVPGLELDRLIFDVLRCKPAEARVRDLIPLVAGDDAPPVDNPEPTSGAPTSQLDPQRARMFDLVRQAELSNPLAFINEVIAPASVERSRDLTADQVADVIDRLERYLAQAEPAEEPSTSDRALAEQPAPPAREEAPVGSARPSQHRRMHALWNLFGYGDDRGRRLAATGRILRRQVDTSADLTEDDAEAVLAWLESQPVPPKARPAAQQRSAPAGSASGPATADQRKEIVRLLDERGLGRPSEKLAFCNEVLAPASVASAKELTEFQAAQVLGALKAPVAA